MRLALANRVQFAYARRRHLGSASGPGGKLPPMAEPTLRDVLDAVRTLDRKVEEHRAETKAGFAAVAKQIAELDADLDRHMGAHTKIEKRLEALEKARAPRPAARRPRAR